MWNRTFLTIWVGAQQYSGTIPNLFIVLVVTQFVFIRNDGNVIDLTLNLRRKVLIGALSVSISLIIAVLFLIYTDLNVVGLSLGLMLGRSIISLGYPMMVGRYLKVPFSTQIRGAVRPVIVTAILFGVTTALSEWVVTSGWEGLSGWIYFALACAVSFVVILALAFFSGLSASQRGQLLKRFRLVVSI
jgi:hypothetical protein